jgi:Ca-activated chloride channel family protein
MRARLALVLCVVLATLSGCFGEHRSTVVLRVLASSELADMQPVLDDLRADTGIELVLDLQGTVDATTALTPGDYHHDLAWLSTDRYFLLKLRAMNYTGTPPLTTSIMSSPVVVGMKPAVAQALRDAAPDHQISWADLADAAGAGRLRFGMADPRRSGSALAALVGVATAAAGTGGTLRPQDVTCDRLRGFFVGNTLTADTSRQLVDEYVAHQDNVDAVVNDESVLLTLNDSGRLRQNLEIVYPRDGIVVSDYPMLLLDPAKRAAYDTVTSWLRSPAGQKEIMERTLRRPLDPTVARDARLQAPIGNALYFPDRQEVVDTLLADYASPALRAPDQVIFALDYSGSMKGQRIAALRATFAGLSGSQGSAGFYRFYQGERFTVLRFGGRVLSEQDFVVNGPSDLADLRAALDIDQFDDSTAVWSTLDYAYGRAEAILKDRPSQRVSIVLMTDGESNAGIDLAEFLSHQPARPPSVHTFAISYGEADRAELDQAARATGGFMVDADSASLLNAFKEIRGC